MESVNKIIADEIKNLENLYDENILDEKYRKVLSRLLNNNSKVDFITNSYIPVTFWCIKKINPSCSSKELRNAIEDLFNDEDVFHPTTNEFVSVELVEQLTRTIIHYSLNNNALINLDDEIITEKLAEMFTVFSYLFNKRIQEHQDINDDKEIKEKNLFPSFIVPIDSVKIFPKQKRNIYITEAILDYLDNYSYDETDEIDIVVNSKRESFTMKELEPLINRLKPIIDSYKLNNQNIYDIMSPIDEYGLFNAFKLINISILGKVIEQHKLKTILKKLKNSSQNINDILDNIIHIDNNFDELNNYLDQIKPINKKRYSTIESDTIILKNILKVIKTNNNNKPININNLNMYNVDSIIQEAIITAIINYNKRFYIQAKETNTSYKNKPYNKLESIFNDFNLPTNWFDNEIINKIMQNHSIEEIEKMLILLQVPLYENIISNSKKISKVLCYSNSCILEKINLLYNKGNINEQLINKMQILYSNSLIKDDDNEIGLYERLIDNINLLEKKIHNLSDISNIALEKPEVLYNSFSILDNYNISYNNNLTHNYDFLINPKLEQCINRFIELDLYSYIKNNPQILKENTNNIIQRIIISRNLGLDIKENNQLLSRSIITGENFLIPTKYLDEYIENNTLKEENPMHAYFLSDIHNNCNYDEINIPILEKLDNTYLNDNIYYLNGFSVSRNKVIKNMNKLINSLEYKEENIPDMLFSSIINNSILSSEELANIKDCINTITKDSEKIKIKTTN